MGLFDRFLGKANTKKIEMNEHAVIVSFQYALDDLQPLYNLEDKLEKFIENEGVGEFDGHEIALDLSDGFLYMYGPNAELLYKAVRHLLQQTAFMNEATALLRFGPPEDGVKELRVDIND